MRILSYTALFVGLSWLVIIVKSRRKLVALTLSGALVMGLVGVARPIQAQTPNSLLSAIQAVLNVIQGLIQTALTAIDGARSALQNLQQVVTWPQQLLNQARNQVTLLVSQYRSLMAAILHINLNSATLASSQAFETLIRDHQVNNFPNLTGAFATTYGLVPATTAASSTDRALSDIDDAFVLDSLKLLKASDQATDVEIQSADSIENAAGLAAPGSTPFLTATAIVAGINSQALTQKMLAAELRQEAARLAHHNTLRKEDVNNTTQLRGVLVNLLLHR
jgi:hypothetical protein